MASQYDWNGLLTSGVNSLLSSNTANNNQSTANNYGNMTQFNPFNINTPNSSVQFNGNNAMGSLSPQYNNIQSQLLSGAGQGFNNYNSNGGIPSWLQGEYNNASANAPQVPGNLASQFNQTSQGFLNGLGSFDPNQAASDYTSNLRQQAMPQQQQAAQGLAQNLFNTGRLGSTGGANIFGQLAQAQNQQDLGFQQAGRDYAGQEQSRLGGLASQFGTQGAQMGDMSFQQGNQRVQQRFQNAMGLFGSGLQGQQAGFGNALGMLQGAQGLDQSLLQAIGLGGNLGAAKSQLNQNAYNPSLQAGVAQNNTQGANYSNLFGSIFNGLGGLSGIANLFGGGGGSSGGGSSNNFLGGYGGDFTGSSGGGGGITDFLGSGGYGGDFSNYGGSGFSGAGGQAADPSGIGYFSPTQTKVPVSGGDAPTTGGSGLGGALNTAGSVAGIYSGIQQGTPGGYLTAANGVANLAGYNIPGAAYAGAIDKAVQGDVGGAGYSAGIAYAGPIAAIGSAIADFANKGGDKDSAAVSGLESYFSNNGWQLVGVKNRTWKMPDGKLIRFDDKAKTFARALMNKASPDEVNSAYADWMSTAKGG